MRAASLTTNIAHLTSERLKPLPFPLAPIEEQAALVKRVRHGLDATTRLRACLEEASAKLSAEERGILTKAFQGALVPQDPAAEPAAAMLARLRALRPSCAALSPRVVSQTMRNPPNRQTAKRLWWALGALLATALPSFPGCGGGIPEICTLCITTHAQSNADCHDDRKSCEDILGHFAGECQRAEGECLNAVGKNGSACGGGECTEWTGAYACYGACDKTEGYCVGDAYDDYEDCSVGDSACRDKALDKASNCRTPCGC